MRQKYICLFFLLTIGITKSISQVELLVTDDTNYILFSIQLQNALLNNEVVCIKTDKRVANRMMRINKTLTVNGTLFITSHLNLVLTEDSNIFLNGGCLIGESHGASRITQSSENMAAVVMNGEDNCIRDLAIFGNCNTGITIDGVERCIDFNGITGVELTSNTNNNEISTVRFHGVENGISIDGSDDNEINDVYFDETSTDFQDCDGTCDDQANPPDNDCDENGNDDPGAAILLRNCEGNVVQNVVHRGSPGAITLWMDEICVDNHVINLTIEQEGLHCTDVGESQPSIFITTDIQSGPRPTHGNIIIANLNGGSVGGVEVVNSGIDGYQTHCKFCGVNSLNILHENGARCIMAGNCNHADTTLDCEFGN